VDGPTFAIHIALEAAAYEAVAGVVTGTTEGMTTSFLASSAALNTFNASLATLKANLAGLVPILRGIVAESVAATASISSMGVGAVAATTELEAMAAAENSVAASSATMSTGITVAGIAIMTAAAGVVALTAGIAALVSAAEKALEAFAAFEQKQANVQAASGESVRVIGMLSDKLLEMAEAGSKFKPTEMSEGLYALASQGYNAQQQLDALPATLTFAAASMDGLDRATESILSGLNNFRLSATDATRVADVYTAAINKSALDAGRLAAAIRTGAPAAGALNQGFEETVAILSILTQRFNNGELAGTGFKSALNQISRQAEKLGIDIKDADGNMLPFADIIDNIRKRGISTQDALKIFGTRAGPALAILMEEGSKAIRDQTKAISSHGQAAEAAAIQLDTLEGDQKKLASAIEAFWITAGRAISGTQRTWVQEQAHLYQQATEWIKAHAEEIKAAWKTVIDTVSGLVHGLIDVVKFAIDHLDQFKAALIALSAAFLVVKIAPLIGLIATFVTNAIAMVAAVGLQITALSLWDAALVSVTAGWEALTTAILANPIGLVAAAISAVVYAFVRWHQELTRMKELQERHNSVMADHKKYLEELKTRTDLLTESEAAYARTKLESLRVDAAQAQAEAEKLRKRDLAHNAPAQQFLFGRVLDENVPLEKDTSEALRFAGGLKKAVGDLEGQLARLGGLSDMTMSVTAKAVEESGKGFEKAKKSVENYRLQIEKLIAQSNLAVAAARGMYQATSLGTDALEAQRIATARLAAEEKAREANEAALARGVSVNPDLGRILADNAEETERWAIALEKLSNIQQVAEQSASDLISPLSDIRQQLDQLQNSRWFTVGIPAATINSAQEWGKTLATVGFSINNLKLNLDNLNRSNPQTIALTKQLAESQDLYQKALADSATQLAIFRAKIQEPAITAAGAAQKEIDLIRDRIAATKAGSVALQTYDILLNAHNEALRIENLLVQQVGESDIDFATRRTRVYLEAFKAMETETDTTRVRTDDFLTTLGGALEIVSAGFGGASTAAGKLAADMGKLVVAIKAVADAQGRANKVLAAASVVQGIGSVLAELNVGGSGKTGGAQALGGRLDSNYAGPGSLIGTIIGAIIGAYLHAPAAGAAIGGALGAVLGGLISKAGDSASASLTSSGNVVVGETSRQLDGAVKDALTNIFKGLQATMASLGLLLQGIPLIDIKVRDNIVRVVVGNVVRTFSSMQDAISFGIAEALKQVAGGAGGHLPPEVLAALKNTTATDMTALQSDIDFAFSIANYGVPKVVQAIDKAISDFFVAMQRAVSLGIDTGKVIAQFADQLRAQKDSILGINRNLSLQDQLRADVKAFNQKVELLRAQELADEAELEGKKADLAAKIALAKAEIGVGRALDIAQLEALHIMEAALAQIDTALAAAQAVLDSLVTISDQELQDALARIGKGGAGSRAGGDALGNLKTMIDEVAKSVRQSGMTDMQKQLDDINQKWKDATGSVHSHSNAQAAAERERERAIAAASKLDKDKQAAAIKAANDRYNKEIAGIAKTQAALDAANRARQQEIDLLAKDLRERVRTFVSTGAPGSGITDALNNIDENAKGLIADARALAKEKGLAPAELHKMVADIRAAAENQMQAVAKTLFDNIGKFLGDDGPTGLIGKLNDVTSNAADLTAGLQALADKGRITGREFEDLAAKIAAATHQQRMDLVNGATSNLFGQLYDLLGMDTEAARLKYDLAIAELNAKKAELEASMRIAGYTQAQMDAVLGPLSELIGKVISAGPSLFESSGGGAQDDRSYAERVAADQAMVNGGAPNASAVTDARAKIQEYLDLALSPFQRSLKALNTEFDHYRLVLGNTAEVQQAYALALHDLVTQQLRGLKDYLDSLNTSPQSILNPEQQLAQVQQQIAQAFALAQGGDASQGDVLARLVQQALQLGQVVFPQAGSGYRDLFTQLNAMLQRVWAMFNNGAVTPSVPPGTIAPQPGPALPIVPAVTSGGSPTITGTGTAGRLVVDFLPVIQQMQLSTTMMQGSIGRVEDQARRTADASERTARALEGRGALYRKVS